MPQVINTNVMSLNAQRNLNSSSTSLATALQRLSSGMRINSAKDDAAGLAISNRMTAQIRGLNQAARNANDGISLAQTAEGDLGAITNSLQRIRELAVQSANATNSSTDRAALQAEASQLIAEIDRLASASSFNGVRLLDGTFTSQQFQVGANANETINVASIASARTSALGQANTASVTGTAVAAALSTGDLTVNGNAVAATSRDAAAIATAINNASSDVTATASNSQAVAFTTVASATVQTATTLNVGAYTQANSDAANAVANASAVSGAHTTSTSSAANEVYTLTVDGVSVFSRTSAGANETVTAANIDTAVGTATAALNAAGVSVSGTAAAGTLAFSRADGAAFNIVVANTFATTAGGFAGGNFATGTNAINNGSVARTDNDFVLSLDGAQVYTESGGVGAQVTAAELDAALVTFVGNSNGAYSITSGTIAGNNLVLSKADGSDVSLSITTNFTAGPAGQAGAFGGSSTATSTNGTTALEAVAPTYSLTVDGTAIDFTTDGANGQITGSELAALVDALDGYTASFGGGNVTITKADGSNISLVESGADSTGAEGFATSSQTLYGTVSLQTANGVDLVIGGAGVANAGLSSGTTAASLSGTTIENTNISTVNGANAAIVSVDAALDTINSSRADLGAIQSRFETVVSALSTTAENLSAARSRIQDADFAAETAALTKTQILQQAGISILSQANAQPQLVLSLLQ